MPSLGFSHHMAYKEVDENCILTFIKKTAMLINLGSKKLLLSSKFILR